MRFREQLNQILIERKEGYLTFVVNAGNDFESEGGGVFWTEKLNKII